MRVRIYSPAKTTMQSGRAKTGQYWLLEPELTTARHPENLMGWTAADDTLVQLLGRLKFPTLDEAQAFATKKGWVASVDQPHERVITPRNYLDNFKYEPPAAKTE